MVRCSACQADAPKELFSSNQLSRKASIRKCRQCLEPVVHDRIADLYRWLKHHGAALQNVQVQETGAEYRTVFANNRVPKNEILLSVPRVCIMTTSDAKASAIGQAVISAKCQLAHNHSWLALYLLQEKRNNTSFFGPYISTLPTHYRNVPLLYTKEELAELRGSFVLGMISYVQQLILEDFERLRSSVPAFVYSLDEFTWARIAVISRIFAMPAISEEGLVPLADMLNHKVSATTNWRYCDQRSAFLIISTCVQMKGLEVFDSYGPKCNSRYFVNYGFTLPNNQANNQADIFIKSPPALSPMQTAVIGQPCSYDDGYSYYQVAVDRQFEQRVRVDGCFRFQIQCPGSNLPSCEPAHLQRLDPLHCTLACLRFLRVIVATAEEQNGIAPACLRFAQQHGPKNLLVCVDIGPISVRNELAALAMLAQATETRLSEFPTGLAADQQLLQAAPPFSNQCNILCMLCSEKQVLTDTLNLCLAVSGLWAEHRSVIAVSKHLRQNPLTSNYAKAHWSKLKLQT